MDKQSLRFNLEGFIFYMAEKIADDRLAMFDVLSIVFPVLEYNSSWIRCISKIEAHAIMKLFINLSNKACSIEAFEKEIDEMLSDVKDDQLRNGGIEK